MHTYGLSERLLSFGCFSDGKHSDVNFQPDKGNQQQQPGNGCNHQGLNQNYKSQPETQAVPAPVPAPTIQYTKVSCIKQLTDLD